MEKGPILRNSATTERLSADMTKTHFFTSNRHFETRRIHITALPLPSTRGTFLHRKTAKSISLSTGYHLSILVIRRCQVRTSDQVTRHLRFPTRALRFPHVSCGSYTYNNEVTNLGCPFLPNPFQIYPFTIKLCLVHLVVTLCVFDVMCN
jgi:hypothetical protein